EKEGKNICVERKERGGEEKKRRRSALNSEEDEEEEEEEGRRKGRRKIVGALLCQNFFYSFYFSNPVLLFSVDFQFATHFVFFSSRNSSFRDRPIIRPTRSSFAGTCVIQNVSVPILTVDRILIATVFNHAEEIHNLNLNL
ncbi:hypothetical protein ISN44_As04g020930, partial [Arabidopsis suecica]